MIIGRFVENTKTSSLRGFCQAFGAMAVAGYVLLASGPVPEAAPVLRDHCVDAREYSTLQKAVAAAQGKTVCITDMRSLSSDLTIPSGVALTIEPGGMISAYANVHLKIQGPFAAGAYRVFAGFRPGNVIFGAGSVEAVLPQWWYEGIGSYSVAVMSAIASHKRTFFMGNGSTYLLDDTILLPAADREIVGNGFPEIKTQSGKSMFEQVHHGVLTVFDGLSFSGNGTAIAFTMKDENSQFKEYDIKNCRFVMNPNVWGIKLVGSREGYVTNSYFETGNGIYTSHANFRILDRCMWKNCGTAIWDDGQGSAFSTGSYIVSSEIIGCSTAVKIQRCDDFKIDGSTIDYNNTGIQLLGQDSGRIVNSYLGSRTSAPAIMINADGQDAPSHINIARNVILGHYPQIGENYDAITIDGGGFDINISHNSIEFWTRHGIRYRNTAQMTIESNWFAPWPNKGKQAILCEAGDSDTNKVLFNTFSDSSKTMSGVNNAMLFNNARHISENSGTAAIAPDRTFATVAHQLHFTPHDGDIMVTPITSLGNAARFWVGNYTNTEFTITVDRPPGGVGAAFAWQARKRLY